MRWLHLCVLAVVALRAPAAQQRATLPQRASEYFPMQAGAKWIYRRTDATGAKGDVEVVCRGDVAAGDRKGVELFARCDDWCWFEYWGVDGSGLWRSADPSERRIAVAGLRWRSAGCWLPAPVGIRTAWEWSASLLQQGGNGTYAPPPHRGAIATFAEAVEVPAGRYTAVHVTIDSRWPDTDDGWRSEVWFAPGVGPVRREEYRVERGVASFLRRDELRSFVPSALGDPLAIAAAFVRANPGLWPKGEPVLRRVELPLGDRAIASRFVFAIAPSGRSILRLHGNDVSVFDLDDLAHVQALLQVEDPRVAAARPDHSSADTQAFARLYFALRSVMETLTVQEVHFRKSRLAGSDITYRGSFTDDRGATLEFEMLAGKLTKVEYRRK